MIGCCYESIPFLGVCPCLQIASSLASVPCYSPPVESAKKRRRFYKKANLGGEMKKEAGRVQESSPCGFPSQVAEPPVRAVTSISHSASSPGHFTLLYHTLVRDGALPSGYFAGIYFSGGTCAQISEQVASFSDCRHRFRCVRESC